MYAVGSEDDGTVIGYMCATDWECEIGLASDGNRIYPSLQDALERLRCARSCGIVEVRVSFSRLVLKGDDDTAEGEDGEAL